MTRTWLLGSGRSLTAVIAIAALVAGCTGGGEPLPAQNPQSGEPQPDDPQAQADEAAAQATVDSDDAEEDVALDDFTEPLSNYGTWIDVPGHGRAWQPDDEYVSADFTPYGTDGEWVAREQGGWVFQSKYDSEWGWATYHYGRWYEHPEYGWVWLPGTTWAPAWVDWRYGGGYVGWVPLGPEGVVIADDRWAFVEERSFVTAGFWGARIVGAGIAAAFGATARIADHRGRGHWSVGPAVAGFKAAGIAVKAARLGAPAKGAAKAHARASTRKAVKVAKAHGGKPKAHAAAGHPKVRTAATRAAKAAVHHEAAHPPAHHEAAKPPAHHEAAKPPAHHEAAHPPAHHEAAKPPAHHEAPAHHAPPAAKPKPAPAPPPKKKK
jgi:hypothetical protein